MACSYRDAHGKDTDAYKGAQCRHTPRQHRVPTTVPTLWAESAAALTGRCLLCWGSLPPSTAGCALSEQSVGRRVAMMRVTVGKGKAARTYPVTDANRYTLTERVLNSVNNRRDANKGRVRVAIR